MVGVLGVFNAILLLRLDEDGVLLRCKSTHEHLNGQLMSLLSIFFLSADCVGRRDRFFSLESGEHTYLATALIDAVVVESVVDQFVSVVVDEE